MKKVFSLLFLFVMIASLVVFPVSATASDYDANAKGRITFTVTVPEGFDEVVIVSLMDTNGGGQIFPVLPESNYVLVENLPSGLYYVSAYVDNDPKMEYIVLRDCDEVTISQEQDAFVNFTVTGGPKEGTEGSESTAAPTEPPATVPAPTEKPVQTDPTQEQEGSETPSGEATTEPSDVDTNPTDEYLTDPTVAPSDPTAEPSDPTEGEGTPKEPGEDKENPWWVNLIFTVLGTAAFVGIVFGGAYLYRKYEGYVR